LRSGLLSPDSLCLLVSKVLLTAVGFDVFTKLGKRRVTGAELGAEVGLNPRAINDFFDALVAMKPSIAKAMVKLRSTSTRPNPRFILTARALVISGEFW
jgi:hypothetical protein